MTTTTRFSLEADQPGIAVRARQFFIGGRWVSALSSATRSVINPATEEPIVEISLGSEADVASAVAAACAAFPAFAATTVEERIELLERIIVEYTRRSDELAALLTLEMGAPSRLSAKSQVPAGAWQFACALDALRSNPFGEEKLGNTTVVHEPIGVCALITPWNWPLHQIAAKVAAALAAGCTMILKPSEVAPLNTVILAEILESAGVPAGVFNLIQGDGPTVGTALAAHPDIDMISFTGSTRAGVDVARTAAPTVKRVSQELGGKSANVILDDADLNAAISRDIREVMTNSGQSCDAATRILVPAHRMEDAARFAVAAVKALKVGQPQDPETDLGPVVSLPQYERIQEYIRLGIDEGARVVIGGPGKPAGLPTGYFVQPTVFADVTNDMIIAQEEIFGPVIVLIGYKDDEDAIAIANDSPYGLSSRVSSADPARASRMAHRLKTGMVVINGAELDGAAPFGGYKQSGNGKEFGVYGIREYMETKSIFGNEAGVARDHAWFDREVEAILQRHEAAKKTSEQEQP